MGAQVVVLVHALAHALVHVVEAAEETVKELVSMVVMLPAKGLVRLPVTIHVAEVITASENL